MFLAAHGEFSVQLPEIGERTGKPVDQTFCVGSVSKETLAAQSGASKRTSGNNKNAIEA